MDNLFKEASVLTDVFIEKDNEISFFYRGFKLTKYKDNNEILIQNIHVCDIYADVHGKLLVRFLANGFERTCDELQVVRDERRINIANYYIQKAILNEDTEKKNRIVQERVELLLNITRLKAKIHAK